MKKLVIITTVPVVLETYFRGQPKFLSNYFDVKIITSNSQNIENIEKYENIDIKLMDFNRKINIFKDLKVLIQLFIYLVKNRPEIVFTLTPKAGLLGMIASWFARIPNRIHSVGGLPHLEALGKRKIILETTEKITYFCANKIYSVSFGLKKYISLLTKKDINVIWNGSVNGVDTDYFKDTSSIEDKKNILKEFQLNTNNFIITFIGRIVKDKGINELLQSFNKLNLKHPSIKLFIIGDYKNESDPISNVSKKIIKENESVIYIEFQEDIRKYLSISNLFVLPSYREGLPTVLIEAGSYGIPLLGTNINGCNEVIIDQVNGALVNKKDEVDLQNAIEKFIIDEEYYKSIKQNVRQTIVDRYSQSYFYKKLLIEFEKIEGKC